MRVCWAVFAAMVVVAPGEARELQIQAKESVDIVLQGQITARCKMGRIDDMDFGDLNRPNLSRSAAVDLDCNVPFSVRFDAEHGMLQHSQMPAGQGPYAGALAYRIGINLPVRHASTTTNIIQSFESRTLLEGQRVSSGGGISGGNMILNVALQPPASEAGLLAGNYGEVVRVTVTPE